jgi:hypothetical protein
MVLRLSTHWASSTILLLLTYLLMEWIPEDTRKRGCSRKTWMEGVKAAIFLY